MADDPIPTIVGVSGGADSTAADLDDHTRVAQLSDLLAEDVQALRGQLLAASMSEALSGAQLLDPFGVAEARAMLDAVASGPMGLDGLVETLQHRAGVLRLIRDNYEESDAIQGALMSGLDWLEGFTNFSVTNISARLIADGVGRLVLPEDTENDLLGPYAPWSNFLGWMQAHPDYAQDQLNSLPGLLKGGPWTSWQDMVRLAAGHLDDGQGVAVADKAATKTYGNTPAPTDLSGIITNLVIRNGQAATGNDEIDVRTVTQADGTTAYIVNIPGTKSDYIPFIDGTTSGDSNDHLTNIVTLAGLSSSREEAIASALQQAGVPHDAPVMLVGHSQGGMIAAQAAADSATGAFDYNITHVITAGSPVALADIPPDVQVLSLENRNDVIPWLDGADNPATANQTTVQFDYNLGSMDNHDLADGYQTIADDLSDQPDQYASVAAFMDSADGFLAAPGGSTTTQVFDLDRIPR